jgi:hypothetical protein
VEEAKGIERIMSSASLRRITTPSSWELLYK